MAVTLDINSVEIIFDIANQLLTCARDGIVNACAAPPARSYVSPGTPAFDDCCDGQLTVHLVRQYPSSTFPAEDTLPGPCRAPYSALQYDITVARCVPSPNDDGSPPSVELLTSASTVLYAEARAVWVAVRCCLDELESRNYVSSSNLGQDIGEPDGGCMTYVMHIVIGIPDCGCT